MAKAGAPRKLKNEKVSPVYIGVKVSRLLQLGNNNIKKGKAKARLIARKAIG